jgi:hypothetical protein
MDRAEASRNREVAGPPDAPKSGLSPTVAFAVLAFLIAVAAVLWIVLTPEESANVGPSAQSENFALTDAEAIARFKELDALSIQAYEQRDTTLLSKYVTSDSPLRESLFADIRQLREDRVLFDPRQVTKSIEVASNTETEVRIRQAVTQRPKFVTESGRDISQARRGVFLVIDWTMHPELGEWKMYDSEVIRSRKLSRS